MNTQAHVYYVNWFEIFNALIQRYLTAKSFKRHTDWIIELFNKRAKTNWNLKHKFLRRDDTVVIFSAMKKLTITVVA